jgi:hypothetical protein
MAPDHSSPYPPATERLNRQLITFTPRDSSAGYYNFVATLPPATPSPTRPTKKFNIWFFRLPRKARDAVYRHLFVNPSGTYITAIGPRTSTPNVHVEGGESDCRNRIIDTSPFRVSRKFAAEASKIFYNENVFRFTIPWQTLIPEIFHPSLCRIRKCWLNITYPPSNKSWIDAYKKANGCESLIRAFANTLSRVKTHNMEWLQVVNSKEDIYAEVNWHRTLQPLAKIRSIKNVHISGRLDTMFRNYLENVMALDESWEYVEYESWIEEVNEQKGRLKGVHSKGERMDLFKEAKPKEGKRPESEPKKKTGQGKPTAEKKVRARTSTVRF